MASGIKNFVDDYGAVGDNSTDNATAWANALADIAVTVNGVKYCRYALFIPPGWYRSSTGYKAVGYKNLTIMGAGGINDGAPASGGVMTVLTNSASVDAVLELDGVADAKISDICVYGSTSLPPTYAIWLHWNPLNSSVGTTRNSFYGMSASGKYRYGWCIGSNSEYYDPYQEDQTKLFNCEARGLWTSGESTYYQRGFQFGTGTPANNLIHMAYYLGSYGHKYGVYCAYSGPISIFGGILQTNDWDLYTGNQNGTFYCQGIRSEASKSGFLYHVGPTSAPMPVTVNDWEFSGTEATADNGYGYAAPVWIAAAGPVNLRNGRIINYDAGTKPRIHIQSGKRAIVHVTGLQCMNTEATEIFKSDSATDVSSVGVLEDYFRCDDGFTAYEYRPGPMLWNSKGSITTRAPFRPGSIDTFSVATNRLKISGTVQAPATPTATQVGTGGSTTYQYKIVYKDGRGNKSQASATASVTNGNATLSSTNYVLIASSNNQYNPEPVMVDVLRYNSGSSIWQALYKDMPITEFYPGVKDDGRALEDSAEYTLPTYDALGDIGVDGCVELLEMSPEPSAPGSNKARLYARDNGAGKTQVVALFPSGSAQVIATEP